MAHLCAKQRPLLITDASDSWVLERMGVEFNRFDAAARDRASAHKAINPGDGRIDAMLNRGWEPAFWACAI
jgi:PHP family Zn ribbon phosphoesterase